MSDGTKIEWCDATVNAINGCSLASPGCTNCYAMKQAHRFPVRQGLTVPSKGGMVWTGEVRLSETALMQPLRWRRPRTIFWNAHGDTFHDAVSEGWIDRLFAVMALTAQHKHLVLTKRSARMREYFDREGRNDALARVLDQMDELSPKGSRMFDRWPLPNVWLGVSVEDQARADERIPDLLATPAAGRFLSCEPLLGPVVIDRPKNQAERIVDNRTAVSTGARVRTRMEQIDGVIVGGESGPRARPMHPDWARSLRDQCAAAGVDFHFKQWGNWVPLTHPGDGFWPTDGGGCIRLTVEGRRADDGYPMQKVGKKHAGRLLDGARHDALPWRAA